MAIKDWGDQYIAPDGPPVIYRHHGCAVTAHTALTCDECGDPLTARDIAPELGRVSHIPLHGLDGPLHVWLRCRRSR